MAEKKTYLREDDDSIDLQEIAYVLLGKIHYIIMFLLLGAVILNMYSYFGVKPTFKSTSRLYVVSSTSDSVVDLTDLNIGTSLTADYAELLLSYPVLDKVSNKLSSNSNYQISSDALKSIISLNNPENTRLLDITATTTDPEFSKEVANTLAQVAVEYIPDTMGTMAPNIAQTAKAAKVQAAPSHMKYTLMGAILGMLCCMAWIVFKYLTDDTIRTREDMEKYFDMVPLAVIPYVDGYETVSDSEKNNKGKRS